jgi:aspartyl/asparaginyl beta-hydroxylase (cupin superfamily)
MNDMPSEPDRSAESEAEIRAREERHRLKREARKERMRARAGRSEGEWPGLRQLARERWRAAILRVGKNSRKRLNAILARHSEVGDPAVFDHDQFPFMRVFEDNWKVVRDEAARVMEARDQLPALSQLSPDHDRLNADGSWKAFILYGYGVRSELGCRVCPKTAELCETVPGLQSAFFSILEPGSRLPRHRGPTKAHLTWHLGLILPREREKCWIQVADRHCVWEEGESLVFDDARKHEVHNETDEYRVVLLIHFRRPMRFPGSLLGRMIYFAIRKSPFITDAKRNQRSWEAAFEAAARKRDAS